ncbi:MAG: carboxypeptidase-like regulatory domain-containing protein [Thermoplasmatota archaeon]
MRNSRYGGLSLKGKKKIALVLFFLLGTSTLLFSAFVLFNTYRIESYDGKTMVMGRVVDSDDEPLKDVMVTSGDIDVLTDNDGYFVLRNVDEGLIGLILFKPGFVRTEINWVAYPLSEIDNEIEGSANDISDSFDIELKREMEQKDLEPYSNGTLTLEIYAEPGSYLDGLLLDINNKRTTLKPGVNLIEVEGNGSFNIVLSNETEGWTLPNLKGFHPVGSKVNITNAIPEDPSPNMYSPITLENGTINLTLSTDHFYHNVHFNLVSLSGTLTTEKIMDIDESSLIGIEIPPGVYSLEVTGESIRDRTYRWIVLNESQEKELEIELVKASTEKIYKLSMKENYFVAGVYILAALLIFGGGILLRRNGPWGWIVGAALLGFITQGFFAFLIFNINHLITIILVVVLFYIRSDLNRIRERRRKAKV